MYDHGFMDNTNRQAVKNWLDSQTRDASLTSWRQPFCNNKLQTRRISVCTEMMALPHSPWQESRLIKPEKISYGFSNHVDLVSQSRLCFYKLISWMLRLIFHQGSIGRTVSQTISPYMWMLSQIIHQSWSNISQWISLKDFLLYLVTRMSLTNRNLYMRKRWRKVALMVICLS